MIINCVTGSHVCARLSDFFGGALASATLVGYLSTLSLNVRCITVARGTYGRVGVVDRSRLCPLRLSTLVSVDSGHHGRNVTLTRRVRIGCHHRNGCFSRVLQKR